MSLPRSFFTHLTLLAGDTFGVNTHQGAFLSRSSLWWNRCTGEQLCKVLNTYSNKNNKICWGSCVYARDCPGGCELDDDKSDLLSSAGSLCPIGAGQCAEIGEQEPEQEQIRTCTGDTLCKTTTSSGLISYSVGSCRGESAECVLASVCDGHCILSDEEATLSSSNGLCPNEGGVCASTAAFGDPDELQNGEQICAKGMVCSQGGGETQACQAPGVCLPSLETIIREFKEGISSQLSETFAEAQGNYYSAKAAANAAKAAANAARTEAQTALAKMKAELVHVLNSLLREGYSQDAVAKALMSEMALLRQININDLNLDKKFKKALGAMRRLSKGIVMKSSSPIR